MTMRAGDYEDANKVLEILMDEIKKLVDKRLHRMPGNQSDYIRTRLNEDMRYWK